MTINTNEILMHFNISSNASFSKVYDLIYNKFYKYAELLNNNNSIYTISNGLSVEVYDTISKKMVLKYHIDYKRDQDGKPHFTLKYLINGIEVKADKLFQ